MARDLAQKPDPATLPRMTYEAFLEWADEDIPAEWVNGSVVLISPASDRHQDLADFLTALLRFFVETHGLGVIRSAPFQMKTRMDLPGREPDILFVAEENQGRLKQNHLAGPADLAIEIVSPESRDRDQGEKFYEYEQGGVREYWLIDPLRQEADFYRLNTDGVYAPVVIAEGAFGSEVLSGLELQIDWLWQEPLPPLMTVLKVWGLV